MGQGRKQIKERKLVERKKEMSRKEREMKIRVATELVKRNKLKNKRLSLILKLIPLY